VQEGAQAKSRRGAILKIPDYRGIPFVRIARESVEDERLGGLACAILVYILSRAPNWIPRSWQLGERFHCSRRTIRMAMKELAAAGYARLLLTRQAGRRGVKGSQWQFRESPELAWPDPEEEPSKSMRCQSVTRHYNDTSYNDTPNKRMSFNNERVLKRKSPHIAHATLLRILFLKSWLRIPRSRHQPTGATITRRKHWSALTITTSGTFRVAGGR
jgi:hypothetical protein